MKGFGWRYRFHFLRYRMTGSSNWLPKLGNSRLHSGLWTQRKRMLHLWWLGDQLFLVVSKLWIWHLLPRHQLHPHPDHRFPQVLTGGKQSSSDWMATLYPQPCLGMIMIYCWLMLPSHWILVAMASFESRLYPIGHQTLHKWIFMDYFCNEPQSFDPHPMTD